MGLLSEVARRRIAALLLVAGALVAAAAVTDAGPFTDPPTEEERARETVEALFGAASEGDFDTYCAQLTAAARAAVHDNAARLLGEGVGGCRKILGAVGESLKGGRLKVNEVSVSSTRARVEVDYRVPGVRGPQPRTVLLELERDGWRVTDPG